MAHVADVFRRASPVRGDDLVACAVVADRVAERQVHVQRERLRGCRVVAGGQRVDVVGGREAGVEAIGGRVRRVARAEAVVLADQVRIEAQVALRSGG